MLNDSFSCKQSITFVVAEFRDRGASSDTPVSNGRLPGSTGCSRYRKYGVANAQTRPANLILYIFVFPNWKRV